MRGARGSLAALLALGCFGSGQAQEATVDPYRLKAAYLYNFSQFIEWPVEAFAEAGSPFVLCVFGPNRFGEALTALERRSARGRPIVVQFLRGLAEARACQILFLGDPRQLVGGAPLQSALNAALGDLPILTVSDAIPAHGLRSAITFQEQEGKLRWIIDLSVIRPLKLKVSAKLLEIALMVVGA